MHSQGVAVTLERHGELTAIAEEWEELADRTGASPLMRPRWVEAWWAAFGSGRLEIAALRQDGRLVAVLPLCRRRLSVQSLTNWHQLEFATVAENDDARARLFKALFGEDRSPVSIRFFERSGSDFALCYEAARERRNRILTRLLERSPYLEIGDGDWERYLGSLERRRLADIRRRRRRLEEQGELRFRVDDGRERLEDSLAAGFSIEGSGWKQETAIAAHPSTRQFYTQVARWAAQLGWLRLAFLELDGRPLAFAFLLQTDAVVFQLKGGYDPRHRKLAPGILLRYEMLARAFSEGLGRFEFLGGEDPDKLIWTNTVHERMLIQVFPRSPVGAAGWLANAHGRPLAKRARAACTTPRRASGVRSDEPSSWA